MSFLGKLVISGPSIATTEVLDELNMLRDNDYVTTIPSDSGAPKWAATNAGISYYNSYNIRPEDLGYEAVESDPNGVTAHEPGAKLDSGKNRLGLVLGGFALALQAVGEVGTKGANKYTDNGWMQVVEGQGRYTDAMMRHLFKELSGEKIDPDLEVLHAAQTAWNALARLELMLRG